MLGYAVIIKLEGVKPTLMRISLKNAFINLLFKESYTQAENPARLGAAYTVSTVHHACDVVRNAADMTPLDTLRSVQSAFPSCKMEC